MKRAALVLGGTGGIGSAIVRRLCAEGIKVYATYHRNSRKAREMQDSFKNCAMLRCDLTRSGGVDKMMDLILKKGDEIDLFINSAASPPKLKLFEALSEEEWLEDMRVYFLSGVKVMRRLLPRMKERQSGTLLMILSSVLEQTP